MCREESRPLRQISSPQLSDERSHLSKISGHRSRAGVSLRVECDSSEHESFDLAPLPGVATTGRLELTADLVEPPPALGAKRRMLASVRQRMPKLERLTTSETRVLHEARSGGSKVLVVLVGHGQPAVPPNVKHQRARATESRAKERSRCARSAACAS